MPEILNCSVCLQSSLDTVTVATRAFEIPTVTVVWVQGCLPRKQAGEGCQDLFVKTLAKFTSILHTV